MLQFSCIILSYTVLKLVCFLRHSVYQTNILHIFILKSHITCPQVVSSSLDGTTGAVDVCVHDVRRLATLRCSDKCSDKRRW